MMEKNHDLNDNLCSDAAIIRDYWFNQGHLLKDDKQEALQDVDQNQISQKKHNQVWKPPVGYEYYTVKTSDQDGIFCDHHELFHPI